MLTPGAVGQQENDCAPHSETASRQGCGCGRERHSGGTYVIDEQQGPIGWWAAADEKHRRPARSALERGAPWARRVIVRSNESTGVECYRASFGDRAREPRCLIEPACAKAASVQGDWYEAGAAEVERGCRIRGEQEGKRSPGRPFARVLESVQQLGGGTTLGHGPPPVKPESANGQGS